MINPPEDLRVRAAVFASGTSAIWTKELKRKTNLQKNQLNKSLKTLEARGLIRSFKPVTARNKKFYISAEFQPAPELTGGAWYDDDGAFNASKVARVSTAIVRIVARHSSSDESDGDDDRPADAVDNAMAEDSNNDDDDERMPLTIDTLLRRVQRRIANDTVDLAGLQQLCLRLYAQGHLDVVCTDPAHVSLLF